MVGGSHDGGGREDETLKAGPSRIADTLAAEATGSGAVANESEPQAGDRIGRYLVVGRLGAGGMGVVLAAYDPELDRRVALKLLRPESDGSTRRTGGDARTRLLREAQAQARLSHPNVVAVFDVGAVGERVWLAMELVEGHTWHRSSSRARRWARRRTCSRSA